MALKSIGEMRRTEIAVAARMVFLAEGAAGMTLDRVAREIGASKGIILHYYATKEALLERVLREVLRQRSQGLRSVTAGVSPDRGGREALDYLSRALAFSVEKEVFSPSIARAWLSTLALAPHDPQIARLRRVMLRRMRSNLTFALRVLIGPMEARPVAESLIAMIDGLWLRQAMDQDAPNPERAAALLQTHLEESLSYLSVQ